jgi:hypothetical protein
MWTTASGARSPSNGFARLIRGRTEPLRTTACFPACCKSVKIGQTGYAKAHCPGLERNSRSGWAPTRCNRERMSAFPPDPTSFPSFSHPTGYAGVYYFGLGRKRLSGLGPKTQPWARKRALLLDPPSLSIRHHPTGYARAYCFGLGRSSRSGWVPKRHNWEQMSALPPNPPNSSSRYHPMGYAGVHCFGLGRIRLSGSVPTMQPRDQRRAPPQALPLSIELLSTHEVVKGEKACACGAAIRIVHDRGWIVRRQVGPGMFAP